MKGAMIPVNANDIHSMNHVIEIRTNLMTIAGTVSGGEQMNLTPEITRLITSMRSQVLTAAARDMVVATLTIDVGVVVVALLVEAVCVASATMITIGNTKRGA